jgi:hypothetical protein
MELKFEIPEGFEMPPDAEVGGEFQAVGTFQDNGDGTLTLIQIDGADVGEMVHDKPEEVEVAVAVETEEPEGGDVYSRGRRAGLPMKM